LALHSAIACIFYFFSGGASVRLNAATLLYALALALLILINMLIGMLKLRYASILGAGILISPINIIFTSLCGVIIFSEKIAPSTYYKVALMTVSALLIYADLRVRTKKEGAPTKAEDAKKPRTDLKKFFPLALAGVLFGALQNVIPKLFAMSDAVTDEHSFYLMTNVFMLMAALSSFAFLSVKNKENLKSSLVIFEPKRLAPTVLNVVSNNIGSLVIIPILATVNLSVYTPVSAAYGVVVSVVASLCFREKLGIYSYLGAAVAILAMII
jgi:drug/metabolite transporter (DMT)-like permease